MPYFVSTKYEIRIHCVKSFLRQPPDDIGKSLERAALRGAVASFKAPDRGGARAGELRQLLLGKVRFHAINDKCASYMG